MTITVITDVPGADGTTTRGVFDTTAEAVGYLRRLSAAEAETATIEIVT